MSIQEILEECYHQDYHSHFEFEKATAKLKALMMECLVKPIDYDFDTHFERVADQMITDIKQKVEGL